jgi:hypothetical protein
MHEPIEALTQDGDSSGALLKLRSNAPGYLQPSENFVQEKATQGLIAPDRRRWEAIIGLAVRIIGVLCTPGYASPLLYIRNSAA